MSESRSTIAAKALVTGRHSYVSLALVRKYTYWKDSELAAIEREAVGDCTGIGSEEDGQNLLRIRLPNLAALSALPAPARLVTAEVTLEVCVNSMSAARQIRAYVAEHQFADTAPTYDRKGDVRFGVAPDFNGRYLTVRAEEIGTAHPTPCCLITFGERGFFFRPSAKEELLLLNHREFWARRLDLWEIPDEVSIGVRVAQLANPEKKVLISGNEERLRALGETVLAASKVAGRVHVSDLLRTLKTESEEDGAIRVDNEWLLPPAQGANLALRRTPLRAR